MTGQIAHKGYKAPIQASAPVIPPAAITLSVSQGIRPADRRQEARR